MNNIVNNFWKLVRELEEYYDGMYTILLKNGLLTKLKIPELSRKRLNEL